MRATRAIAVVAILTLAFIRPAPDQNAWIKPETHWLLAMDLKQQLDAHDDYLTSDEKGRFAQQFQTIALQHDTYQAEAEAQTRRSDALVMEIAAYNVDAAAQRAVAAGGQARVAQYYSACSSHALSSRAEVDQCNAWEARINAKTDRVNAWKAKLDASAARLNAERADLEAATAVLNKRMAAWDRQVEQFAGSVEEVLKAGYRRLVPIPSALNSGYHRARPAFMLDLLGEPGELTTDCAASVSPRLARLMSTESVGPFSVTGLRPAVAALRHLLSRVKVDRPGLYAQVGAASMLCVRAVRNLSPPAYSNHSWGTAVDLMIGGYLVPMGSTKASIGLLLLYPYFHDEGFFWGAGFYYGRSDPMHFEASTELLQQWASEGQLKMQ